MKLYLIIDRINALSLKLITDSLVVNLRGWKNIENLLENYSYKMAVAEHSVLFKLLARGRLIWCSLIELQYLNYQISPSQHWYLVYLVVHKKHAKLVFKI